MDLPRALLLLPCRVLLLTASLAVAMGALVVATGSLLQLQLWHNMDVGPCIQAAR
jgi:hypothetical protein